MSHVTVVWKVFNSDNVLDLEIYYFTSESKAYAKVLELTGTGRIDEVWDYERCEVQ